MSDEAVSAPEVVEGQEQEASQPSKKPAPKMRKVGDEYVDEEQVFKDYQKFKGADSKFREAAKLREQAEAQMKKLIENPEEFLADPKIPQEVKRKLWEKLAREALEAELNPPDPRDAKLSETEKKLKEYQEKEEKEKQTKAEQAEQAGREASMKSIGETLRKAGQLTHLSAHPESEAALLREMATYMRA